MLFRSLSHSLTLSLSHAHTQVEEDSDAFPDEVPMLSWEFLALLATLIAMSPWWTWRCAPGTQRNALVVGRMDVAHAWYIRRLREFQFYERGRVVEAMKAHLTKFFEECPEAWERVLTIKATGRASQARRTSSQEPPVVPMDEAISLD